MRILIRFCCSLETQRTLMGDAGKIGAALGLDLLNGRVNSERLGALYNHLLRSNEKIKATYHPLGFLHVSLTRDGPIGVRLHIWSPTVARPQEPLWPIHNHIFDTVSYAIAGRIENVI